MYVQYTLETFTEVRSTAWEQEPYTGIQRASHLSNVAPLYADTYKIKYYKIKYYSQYSYCVDYTPCLLENFPM